MYVAVTGRHIQQLIPLALVHWDEVIKVKFVGFPVYYRAYALLDEPLQVWPSPSEDTTICELHPVKTAALTDA